MPLRFFVAPVVRTLNKMEGLLAAFDDMSLSTTPFSLSNSTLLADLLALKQPIQICYQKALKVQFYLDLNKPSFKHSSLEKVNARSIFIEKKKTNDDRVVLFGKIETGHLWTVKIKRKRTKKGTTPRYKATVRIGSKRFKDRNVREAS